MTLYETLAKAQRNFLVAVFAVWLLQFLAVVTMPRQGALLVNCAAITVMLLAFVYFYRSARCPRCSAKLWLLVSRLVPMRPFKPKLSNCPSCGVPAHEPAAA
jgi:hypothetical protein